MLSLVIPTYNEKENIEELIDRISETLDGRKYEIIVVDDNSPDSTWKLAKKISKKNKKVKVIRRINERGLSSAVIRGFESAKGDILGVMDADLSHDEEILPEMLDKTKDYPLVIGSRRVEGGGADKWPIHRKFTSWVANLLARIILGVKIKDPMSGYFMLKKELFKSCKDKLDPKGYKILLEIYYLSKPERFIEVPYVFKDRKAGHSKLTGSVIRDYVVSLFQLRKQ